jgi:hypothetical protein
MDVASAYPNSALSGWTIMAIAFVALASLACWLVLVFLADRATGNVGQRDRARLPVVAPPDGAAQDKESDAGLAQADRPHGMAA